MKRVFVDTGGFVALLVAITLLRAHSDKDYSLCDALSFVVMERLGISEAVAFDRHFREYGRFTILR